MDSKGRSKGPVPFPGVGTRLRRSRSREHSNENNGDNSLNGNDFDMRSTLRAYESYQKDPTKQLRGVGTLERPKRLLVGGSGRDYHQDSTFTGPPTAGPLSGVHHYGVSRSRPNIYEDSSLLASQHQYEEPQLLMQRDAIYDISARNRRQLQAQRQPSECDSYNHYLDGIQAKTTVISASALFGASNKPATGKFSLVWFVLLLSFLISCPIDLTHRPNEMLKNRNRR